MRPNSSGFSPTGRHNSRRLQLEQATLIALDPMGFTAGAGARGTLRVGEELIAGIAFIVDHVGLSLGSGPALLTRIKEEPRPAWHGGIHPGKSE